MLKKKYYLFPAVDSNYLTKDCILISQFCMEIWRTERWRNSYSIIQRRIERDGNRVPAPWVVLLWPLHGVLWCNWSSVPLVCLLQVNSMLTSLLRGDGGAGGWRGEKTTGLAYRQGSCLQRGEETMWCSVFFFLLTWLSSSKKILHCSQTLGLWGLTFSAFQWHCLTVKSHAATGHQGKDPGNKYVRK